MADERRKRSKFFPPKSNFVTVENGKRLVMEAVERIVFCDDERIVLAGARTLEIRGFGLRLVELGNDNMAVEGRIREVLFSEVEK